MRYLIDTNVLIWFIEDNPKLPTEISDIINNDEFEIVISIISLWEISIKHSLGKLQLPFLLEDFINEVTNEDYFTILDLKIPHILKLSELPFYHRDPFDRLIYAQVEIEKIDFLYTDQIFNKYLNKE